MTMPFGRFKGDLIRELPDWYITWIASNIELRNPLKSEIADELRFRDEVLGSRNQTQRPTQTVTSIRIEPSDAPILREIFERGFRATAKSSHPDAGGDHGSMVHLNRVAESVRSQLRELGA